MHSWILPSGLINKLEMIQCIYGGKTVQSRSHAFVEIDYETLSPSTDSRRDGVSYKRKYMHGTKSSLLRKRCLDMTIVVDLCGSILFAKVHI